MHVERTPGLDPFGGAEGAGGLHKPTESKAGGPKDTSAAEPAHQPSAEPYLERAREAPEVRESAVAEARRLLAEGTLDTPEAARRAAEALLQLGI
jgi:hypothetical protein